MFDIVEVEDRISYIIFFVSYQEGVFFYFHIFRPIRTKTLLPTASGRGLFSFAKDRMGEKTCEPRTEDKISRKSIFKKKQLPFSQNELNEAIFCFFHYETLEM